LAGIPKRPAPLTHTHGQEILDQHPLSIRKQLKPRHYSSLRHNTETTINDTYDFNIGRRLTNLPALRKIGSANRRLLDVQRLSHDPADATTTLTAITQPVHTKTGQRV
jgi:hypothetical protein